MCFMAKKHVFFVFLRGRVSDFSVQGFSSRFFSSCLEFFGGPGELPLIFC